MSKKEDKPKKPKVITRPKTTSSLVTLNKHKKKDNEKDKNKNN
jgi:hypothetical protein